MIQIPFTPEKFAREMKPKISGANLNLDYENIESSLYKVAVEITEIISQKAYDRLIQIFTGEYTTPDDDEKVKTQDSAVDYLQRAMLHLCIYEHSIFLIAQIKNDGITVQKTDNDTTIYISARRVKSETDNTRMVLD